MLRIGVVKEKNGAMEIGGVKVPPGEAWAVRNGQHAQRAGPGDVALPAEQEILDELAQLPMMKDQRVYYWGQGPGVEDWSLEGEAGIAVFAPNQRDTDRSGSSWVIATREVPDLRSDMTPIDAATTVLEHLARHD